MTHRGELLSHLARLAIHTLPRVRLVAIGLDCTIVTLCVPAILTFGFSMRMVIAQSFVQFPAPADMSPLDGALWSALLDHHLSGVRMQKARDPCEMAGLATVVTACVLYIISVSYGQIDY